jgi:hypothetical protein
MMMMSGLVSTQHQRTNVWLFSVEKTIQDLLDHLRNIFILLAILMPRLALFRLYEETEQGAHDNIFISQLNESISEMNKSQQVERAAHDRVQHALKSAQLAESAICIVLKYLEVPLPPNASKEEYQRNYECKIWLRHHAWTKGSFTFLDNTIKKLSPNDVEGFIFQETVQDLDRAIKSIKLTTTTSVLDAESESRFNSSFQDFLITSKKINSILKKTPQLQRKATLIQNLGAHLLIVLSFILECSKLQEKFSEKEQFAVLEEAMKLLKENTDCDVDHRETLMEMWTVVGSLSDSGEYSLSIAKKVDDSVKKCHNYSRRSLLGQILKWYEHQIQLLSEKFTSAKNEANSRSWWSGAGAAVATLSWLLVAPYLLVSDAVHQRKRESSSFHHYNEFIQNNWKSNTTITLLCFLGLSGLFASAAATWAGTIAFAPMAIHLLTATVFGVAVGSGTYLTYHHVQHQITMEEEAEKGQLTTVRDLKLLKTEEETNIDHEKYLRKMKKLGDKMAKVFEDDSDSECDHQGEHSEGSQQKMSPNEADAMTSMAPHSFETPNPTVAPVLENTPEANRALHTLKECWDNLTQQQITEMQAQIQQEIENKNKEEAELDAQLEEMQQRSQSHSRLMEIVNGGKRWFMSFREVEVPNTVLDEEDEEDL